jgi:hypothetical protein
MGMQDQGPAVLAGGAPMPQRAGAASVRELSDRTGRTYRYLSSPRPAGHQGCGDDMAMFAAHKLSHCKRARARAQARGICDLFEPIFDSILDYGTAYPAAAQTSHRPRALALAGAPLPLPQRPVDAGLLTAPPSRCSVSAAGTPSGTPPTGG